MTTSHVLSVFVPPGMTVGVTEAALAVVAASATRTKARNQAMSDERLKVQAQIPPKVQSVEK